MKKKKRLQSFIYDSCDVRYCYEMITTFPSHLNKVIVGGKFGVFIQYSIFWLLMWEIIEPLLEFYILNWCNSYELDFSFRHSNKSKNNLI